MKKAFPDYFLGLDIGTDSVGWAVTDENYKLQKLNGKTLWGIRLFEAGKTAEERRMFRAARRRLQRRNQRLELLQEIFAEEISKIDQGFYQRMKESFYQLEDKTKDKDKNISLPYALFADKDYTDKDYHKEFPTIYHLRKALVEPWKKKYDIRLVYLAIHHILKNRGHFLFEGQDMKNINSFDEVFHKFLNTLREELELDIDCKDAKAVEDILKNKKLGKKAKTEQLSSILVSDPKSKASKQILAFIGLIVGSAGVKLSNLFACDDYEESEIVKIDFTSSKYDEDYDKLASLLEDKICCVDMAKAIYDWALLADIRQGYKYLSESKVATYEKHDTDLAVLKKIVKEKLPAKYDEIFESCNIKGNYASYVAVTHKNGKKIPVEKNCSYDEFADYLKNKVLKGLDGEAAKNILIELENRTFLPKQRNGDNSVIPYQMHREELVEILKNASAHYEFFDKADSTGYSAKEKIEKLLTFRIPYYVGPLNDAHKDKGSNCWIVKNSNEKIRPWNFEKVVNVDACAEEFITRMTNKCTYLVGADVLPKNSLLYSEFMVLNELSNLRINGELINIELKKKIFNDLFKNNKKVTLKVLKSYLYTEKVIEKEDFENENLFSGIDEDFKASLASYFDLKSRIGNKINDIEMSENLIKWIVLFGDDRKILEKRIRKVYSEKLTDEEIKSVVKLKYTGWGKLSREFLENIIHVDKQTGECINIINALRGDIGENLNLMQLLSSEYDYAQAIETYNSEKNSSDNSITYDKVKELYVSPAVKRGIWQTLTIVKEIRKFMGKAPKKVFVEVAREEGEKKRTVSRKNTLLELYKACKKESRDWLKELNDKSEADLRSDQLYLYYTQMGRCMYSGEPIELSQLFDKNVYDIDHIYPQSKVKDDSIENRVLVKKTINLKKSNKYPLPSEIQNNMADYWRMLYSRGFIGKKKIERLTRVSPFSEGELADFIARQLVETRQSTKAVAQILEQIFPRPDTEIVYVKAGNVSDFRHDFDMIKVRDINDLHHAKDAYLNIVVGNVYNTKFTHSPLNFIKHAKENEYSLRRMFDFDVERNGKIAWKASKDGENGTIAFVKATMNKNDVLFTRYATEQKGGLFDVTILKKGNGQHLIKGARLNINIEKYGGYNKVKGAYFMLVEHLVTKGKKTQKMRSIEYVPLTLAKKLDTNCLARIDYCKCELGLNNPEIIIPKIKFNTLLSLNGSRMHLSSRSGNSLFYKGANQLCLSYELSKYLKGVFKYLERCKEARKELEITPYDNIDRESNIKIYNILKEKIINAVYKVSLSSQKKTLENGVEIFNNKLSVFQQCQVLNSLIGLCKCNVSGSDLKLLGGGGQVGIITTSKFISPDLMLINQSPTGVFEQVIDLSTCKP